MHIKNTKLEKFLTDNADNVPGPSSLEHSKTLEKDNGPVSDSHNQAEDSGSRLKYGPVGPGDRRGSFNRDIEVKETQAYTDDDLDSSDGSQIKGNIPEAQVPYELLKIDSDCDCDCNENNQPVSNAGTSYKFVNIQFPNPDNYEDPRNVRGSLSVSPTSMKNMTSEPTSLDYANSINNKNSASKGDFNEIGIPLVIACETKKNPSSANRPTILEAHMEYMKRNPSRELLSETANLYKSTMKTESYDAEENRNFRLGKMIQSREMQSAACRPPSRDQASSGFGSLQDMGDKPKLNGDHSDSCESFTSKASEFLPPAKGGPLCTNL